MEQIKDKETILFMLHRLSESIEVDEQGSLLHPVYRELSELLGLENAIELYRLFAGQQITFPVRFLYPEAVKQRITEEFDGTNIKALAKKYGYCEKTIRRNLAKVRNK